MGGGERGRRVSRPHVHAARGPLQQRRRRDQSEARGSAVSRARSDRPDDPHRRRAVAPAPGYSQQESMDEVVATLRSIRGLKPGDENNFSIVTQDKLLDSWNKVTGMFFLVMLVLSSIGLMVGGVGVISIMMISVTERTREFGVRKALGATRRAIL